MSQAFIDELPSIKSTTMRLMTMVLDPEVSMNALADTIKYDVALAAKVIQIANSAKYNNQTEVTELDVAVKKLGLDLLKNLILSLTVIDLAAKHTSEKKYHLMLSKYAIATATASQSLSHQAHSNSQGLAYLAGLMLYVSLFFIASKFETSFKSLLKEASERNIRLTKVIQEKFSINPYDISNQIAQKWQLPEVISSSIHLQSHAPDQHALDDPQLMLLANILNAASLATEPFFGTGIKRTYMMQFKNQCKEIGLSESTLLKSTFHDIHNAFTDLKLNQSMETDFNKVLIQANRELAKMNTKYESLYQELSVKNNELNHLNQELNDNNQLLKSKMMYDDLTEVFNRRYFETELERVYANHRRGSQAVCLLLIDLDNFKFINDTFGHQIGDEVLKHVAMTVKSSVRKQDIVARIGGDEFAIFPQGMKDERDAAILANSILEKFAEPIEYQGKKITTSVSIGISTFKNMKISPSELLKDADIAMYKAKAKGKNGYYFFDDQLDQESKKRIAIELSLSKSLERNEFKIVYQPIIKLSDNKVHDAEVLLRWQRPLIKEILPEEFIPYLEESGQIIKVGQWVINEVISQIASWKTEGMKDILFHLNISSKQLNKDFVPSISDILKQYNVSSHLLGIELTESTLYQNHEEIDTILTQLSAMAMPCSIDDFGTGYSSLMRLKDLPFQTIKIDRAFISTMFEDDNSRHIVEAIIFLAKRLNLRTVAEGVEHEQEVVKLREWGCDYIQGFYFSKPLDAELLFQYVKYNA